ncbi:type II toxin-antitoxin system RelE/ParE family toxin [Siccirubricoccus sp. KC 17139]|uniref:Type II toxin-antitoxin system RelE/ParE family toxin n=1 Tax=Siccirubricoccus soli TaxID=2899147 RepID=A0ABT1D142_9PROT|nr:type II toxin-antitoxin system RelE/ParE family toxin [Siccirubricoccus soli]MCO6415626.1 type II toxin-antitoxin system RelE/ParE family toxin [Siccirubricoccus soli]MCP2681758.1 type II toxin-antitoxin system RelE/ParE family toxin [Siccirubricoccus soli]
MELLWSPLARAQLREARDFIAQDNPDAADRLVAAIETAAAHLLVFPQSGQATGQRRRAWQVPRTPFRLIYRVRGERLDILMVWHGARAWPFDES